MKIGIIEDDKLLSQALDIAFNNAGYRTVRAYNKKSALCLIDDSVSLLIIDIGLPDGNGIELYQEIRQKWKIPAIFLTARDEETDMIDAFNMGAEDYVVKPFSMKILIKRVEAVLRRSSEDRRITCRDITVFTDRKQVFLGRKEIALTAKEYQLLEYLMMNQG